MVIAILSDIHGNISALKAVHRDLAEKYLVDGIALLGDVIDYGQHSNEVIEYLKEMEKLIGGKGLNVFCNIFGNHEDAICNDPFDPRFSSDRTRACCAHTAKMLTGRSLDYIKNDMNSSGQKVFKAGKKTIIAVHGSISDPCWGSITPAISHGLSLDPEGYELEKYRDYDVVLSGHTHVPHYFEGYVAADDPGLRNKKKIIFINPGSVGQPRNRNNMAQYAVFDTETEQCDFRKVKYDIQYEMAAFDGSVDDFYRERLMVGI